MLKTAGLSDQRWGETMTGSSVGTPRVPWDVNQQPSARLEMAAQDLASAVSSFGKMLKGTKPIGNALLTFDGSNLRTELGGMAQKIAAKGTWMGEASVAGEFVKRLSVGCPTEGSVQIAVADGRLHVLFGSTWLSSACAWEPAPRRIEGLPFNAGLREKVAFGNTHTGEELAHLGLTAVIEVAMAEASRRLRTALDALAPLGVTDAELREIVHRKNGSA